VIETLNTPRKFSISGDATASPVSFNGSADVVLTATVTQIQGNDVSATLPAAGQALIWSATNAAWTPSSIDAATLGGVTASSYLLAASGTANELYNTGWYRSIGNVGWYSQSYGGGIYMTDSTWIRTYGGKSFYVAAGNLAVNGSVGIGTTSPAYPLDVVGAARISGALTTASLSTTSLTSTSLTATNLTASTATITTLSVGTLTTTGGGVPAGSGTVNYVTKWATASTLGSSMLYDSGTGIGIGTTSPAQKLDVQGGNLRVGSSGAPASIYYGGRQLIYFNADSPTVTAGQTVGGLGFYGSGVSHGQFSYRAGTGFEFLDVSADNPSLAHAATTYAPIYVSNLYAGGSVGIGTASPGQLLSLYTAGAPQLSLTNSVRSFILTNNSSDNLLSFNYGGANRLQFDTSNQWFNSGNVGIGTTSPAYPLTVAGNPGGSAPIVQATSSTNSSYTWGYTFLTPSLSTGNVNLIAMGGVAYNTNNAAYMGFRYAGSGSTSNALTWGLYSNDQLMTLLGTGNLGIGTTSPGYKLDVSGNARISGGLAVTGGALDLSQTDTYLNTRVLRSSGTDGMFIGYAGGGGNIHFYSNSGTTEYMTIATTGNVGIGATSPAQKLDVNGHINISPGSDVLFGSNVGADSTSGVYWHTAGGGYGIHRTSGGWSSPNYQQLLLDWDTGIIINGGTNYGKSGTIIQPSGGNVGIGTSSPAYTLDVNGKLNLQSPAGYGGVLTVGSPSVDYPGNSGWVATWNSSILLSGLDYTTISWHDSGTSVGTLGYHSNQFFFDGAGSWGPVSLGINTRSPGYTLHVVGNVNASTGYYQSSDLRLKQDIKPVAGALEKLMKIEGVSFQWKKEKTKDYGVIAQNVEKVFPELVSQDKEGIKSVKYNGLTAPIIEAIRELKNENEAYKKRITALEARIDRLTAEAGVPPVVATGKATVATEAAAPALQAAPTDSDRNLILALCGAVGVLFLGVAGLGVVVLRLRRQ
jgi:hypothetical protein